MRCVTMRAVRGNACLMSCGFSDARCMRCILWEWRVGRKQLRCCSFEPMLQKQCIVNACEKQVKTCMRIKEKSHVTFKHCFLRMALTHSKHGHPFLARVAREMFESVGEPKTPALGSRATLCADSLVPLPRQRSTGTCRKTTAKQKEQTAKACY